MLKGYEFIYVIYHKFAVYVNVTVLEASVQTPGHQRES